MSGRLNSALVVDDDEFAQSNLCGSLRALGFGTIYSANNGRSAVSTLDLMPHPPELIICDVFMPDMDGIEFVVELSRRRYLGGLILVTGVSKDMLEVAKDIALSSGIHVLGSFTKPLSPKTLAFTLGFVGSY